MPPAIALGITDRVGVDRRPDRRQPRCSAGRRSA